MINYFDPRQQKHTDLGTPASLSETLIKIEINGQQFSAPEGSSIMRAALINGVKIPKLCATDTLEAFGSCRLCAVKVEGRRGLPASCTTPIESGMKITTADNEINKFRKNILELTISDHCMDCLICPANGNCELQDEAATAGIRTIRYAQDKSQSSDTADSSNPYFSFDPTKCIVCSRCVRACDEIQGSFALTMVSRGFDTTLVSGADDIMSSECVSCGACVKACPTSALSEKSLIEMGTPEKRVETTCGYCGVGCSLAVDVKDNEIVRMVPTNDGAANSGHSCVKGRFGFEYATHSDRVTSPRIRDSIDQPWQEVSWDEAITFAAKRLKQTQQRYGQESVGVITSSRCTNEETYLVQKLVRAALGNNNTDTCARVCHSPTGYGLKQTLGESAGTQTFESVLDADVILVIGANPTDAHPVFGSLLRKRLRQGAKLIVADPIEIDILKSVNTLPSIHLPLKPGSNVAFINAMAYTILIEGLEDKLFIEKRCEPENYAIWKQFILEDRNSPEAVESFTGLSASLIKQAARQYAQGQNAAIYYGLGVTEHSQGSTMVMGIANLAMLTGNIGRSGVGVNPLRGQNNVQGSCDMGSFPHELPGYQSVEDDNIRRSFEQMWGVKLNPEPGLRIPNMFDAAIEGSFKGLYVQGEDIAQSDPNTKHVLKALSSLDCLIVQDIFDSETAKFAHVLLPGSSFLEKNGTFTNAERRINQVRKVIEPIAGLADWEITMALSTALGYPMNYESPESIMEEISQLIPSFEGVSFDKLEQLGSIQWPCNSEHPDGTPIMHADTFSCGLGKFQTTEYVPTTEKVNSRFPLILTTGRTLTQYNVGTQTRRTKNSVWHDKDVLEIHPFDANERCIAHESKVVIESRSGQISLVARHSTRMQPGVVYTTFHHPVSGTNIITTSNCDWATSCPEYKVTAVQVKPESSQQAVKE